MASSWEVAISRVRLVCGVYGVELDAYTCIVTLPCVQSHPARSLIDLWPRECWFSASEAGTGGTGRDGAGDTIEIHVANLLRNSSV